jgi:hypothetical protein
LLLSVLQRISPPLVDRLMLLRGSMFRARMTDQPDDGVDNLFKPTPGSGSARGEWGADGPRNSFIPATWSGIRTASDSCLRPCAPAPSCWRGGAGSNRRAPTKEALWFGVEA